MDPAPNHGERVSDGVPDPQPAGGTMPPITKIVIAIHGIGSQRRSATIRSVARRFGDRSSPPLPVMPLGYFYIGKAGEVHVSRLEAEDDDPLAKIGFAEVFWADIPKSVVKDDDTLEETKAWAQSVVSRAQALYMKNVRPSHAPSRFARNKPGDDAGPVRQLSSTDFALGAGVVEELIETVAVLENLSTIADKAGIFKFELASLLRDYVGDVQLVTDFQHYRERIVYKFHDAMAQIVDRFNKTFPGQTPELYIVAHSEGTVVSLLGLLQAIGVDRVTDPTDAAKSSTTDWIRHVRGFMTIGSPIDKHLALWPNLFKKLNLRCEAATDGSVLLPQVEGTQSRRSLPARIRWRNYYDYGDPVGFKLDMAADFLDAHGCGAFEFEADRHNHGFSRYWLPGKAHSDYWDDPEVFGHFIDEVVSPAADPRDAQPPPANKFGRGVVSTAIPYLVAAALHFAAVFVFFKALNAFIEPGNTDAALVAHRQFALDIVLLGLLLLGVTVAARLPQLARREDWRWAVVALLALAAGIVPCMLLLPPGSAAFIGDAFSAGATSSADAAIRGKSVLAAVATAAVLLTGWIVPRSPKSGRRRLLLAGCALVVFIVVGRLWANEFDRPVWPVVLAGAAFLYLWWLGMLVFDLGFIWHRYIRNSVAVDALSKWGRGEEAMPMTLKELYGSPSDAAGATKSRVAAS
ncbi:conserved membrane hypothetical protein [Burkholderiales bacterium 8X]|nr:conserved membrane hypothetical protein [Burkholderiales bacterium 8X]